MGWSPAVVGVIQRHVMLVPVCRGSVGRRGKTPQVLRSLHGQSRASLSSVLQSEEQTACVPGAIRRMWFGGGLSVLLYGDGSAGGEVRPEQLLPERGVSFSLILTSALPFLANVTDLPPLIRSQGFPFWAYHPLSSQGCGRKNQTLS